MTSSLANYVLFGHPMTRSVITEMVLEEAGVPYEMRIVNTAAGDHTKAEFLTLNPAGFVPALVTPEGEVIHEAAATALYVAERHGLQDLVPSPTDADRGRFLARLFFQTNDIQPLAKQAFYPKRFALRETDVALVRQAAIDKCLERWRVVESWLEADGPYLLGSRFSLADLHLVMWAAYGLASERRAILDACPRVAHLLDLCLARPRSGPCLRRIVETAELTLGCDA